MRFVNGKPGQPGKRPARLAATACTSHEQTLIQRRIVTTDQEIDRLVYELYGLTDEEIAIVEEEAVTG